jgi:hypothetical protein
MMKYTHLTIICCLLLIFIAGSAAKAQTDATDSIAEVQTDTAARKKAVQELRHEIAVFGAGGMSVLNYSLDMNGYKLDGAGSISGLAGIAYTWNINSRTGIVTGVEIASYGAKTIYDAISLEKTYGTGRNRFDFRYAMNNYVEEQSIVFLVIPVMLQYSVPLSKTKKFYVSGGVKAGLPVKSEATIFPGAVNTSGYYYFENQTYTDLPKYGFFLNQNPGSLKDDIDTNISLAASFESGIQFRLHKNILCYTGAYLDCGLNNIRATEDRDLISYQLLNPSVLKFAGVLNTPHVNNVRILGAGLKVKLAFGWFTAH